MANQKNRNLTLDLIRYVAVATVIGVHFFLNSEFYSLPSGGPGMAVGAFLRTQLMVCVPLFLLLTGYLNCKKVWSLSYYKGILSFAIPYILASLFCCVFRAIWLEGAWSPIAWFQGIMGFYSAPYSWYIELYIGIFLLIPFLNALWKALPSQMAKGALVLSLLFLSVAPTLNPISQHFGWQLFPSRFDQFYPFAYYFTGCYLREYPPALKKRWYLLVDLLAVLIGGGLHIIQARGAIFDYFPPTYWNGPFTYLATVCVFLFLSQCRPERLPKILQRNISFVAPLSLPVFLLSWIPDQLVYPILIQNVSTMAHRLPFILLTVPAVLTISVLLALVVQLLDKGIQAGINACLRRARP